MIEIIHDLNSADGDNVLVTIEWPNAPLRRLYRVFETVTVADEAPHATELLATRDQQEARDFAGGLLDSLAADGYTLPAGGK